MEQLAQPCKHPFFLSSEVMVQFFDYLMDLKYFGIACSFKQQQTVVDTVKRFMAAGK
jgi:ABC-type dipeptide/oligopeptide/nickel transport system permease component